MDAHAITTQAELSSSYWWFVGRRRVIQRVLERTLPKRPLRILDWGCGPGGNFPLLARFGSVTGVDASDESLRRCRQQGFAPVVKAATPDGFHSAAAFDVVTSFDVLEHIRDDVAFLRDLRRHLKPGGILALTVPAYQFLWSELDDAVGHVRRYARGELVAKCQQAGYRVRRASYFVTALALPMIVFRWLGKISGRTKTPRFTFVEFPRPVNWLFTRLVFLEAWLLRSVNLPFGTSIMVVAEADGS